MGDRANIILRYQREGKAPAEIVLYAHNGGGHYARSLRDALAKRWRWDDPQYLGRIIFDSLLDGQYGGARGGETGFGIAPWIGDNGHNFLIVEMEAQTVIRQTAIERNDEYVPDREVARWTFEQFAALSDTDADAIQ